jgi:hypothetical protein
MDKEMFLYKPFALITRDFIAIIKINIDPCPRASLKVKRT